MKFRAHETFFIRKGWLNKGLKNVNANPNVFMGLDKCGNKINPMDVLGIGANMVKSLRYWMQAAGLTEEKLAVRKIQELTPLGKVIYKNDPYIEETGTLCLLHHKLCTNKDLATAWYFLFNEFSVQSFTRDDFVSALDGYAQMNAEVVSHRSLEDDFNCIVGTYVSREERSGNARVSPENSIDCPFGDLGLIEPYSKKARVYSYRKRSISKADLHPVIALAVILEHANGNEEIPIGALLNEPCSLGRVFNLDTIALSSVLSDLDALGYLKIIRTAGLDIVRITNSLTYEKCVSKYYNLINRGSLA